MRILILNGPNLNMTGKREPEIYGRRSLEELMTELSVYAESISVHTEHIQTNYEGRLIDELQRAGEGFDGVILNAGALTHYSYALHDAVACCAVPVAEVHLSDILSREDFRKTDVLYDVCAFRIMGKGIEGYKEAMKRLTEIK